MEDHRILVVEDEPVTRMVLDAQLRATGFLVTTVESAEVALGLLKNERFAVLVTDLLLQQMDGLTLLREARAQDSDLEVIVLTGAASLESAIAAVNHGACAYLRKPIRSGELEDRVVAALEKRRQRIERTMALRQLGAQLLRLADPTGPTYGGTPDDQRLRVGRLEIDPLRRRVSVGPRAISLSSGEFDLLFYLARHDNRVVSAEQIAREAFAYHACSTLEARELVKARIHRLRRKLEPDPQLPSFLVCVRGAGYMLTSEETDSS